MEFLGLLDDFKDLTNYPVTTEKIYARYCSTQSSKSYKHLKRNFKRVIKRWRVSLNENYLSYFKVSKEYDQYPWKF